jgi:hypothetical protein
MTHKVMLQAKVTLLGKPYEVDLDDLGEAYENCKTLEEVKAMDVAGLKAENDMVYFLIEDPDTIATYEVQETKK